VRRGDRVEHREVQALVEDAEEAEARVPEPGLILRLGHPLCGGPGPGEVARVHAAGQAVHPGMPRALRLVEAHPAGEDEIGPAQERGLHAHQLRRRAEEQAQLVHAVVDHETRRYRVQDRFGHGRVDPGHWTRDLLGPSQVAQQPGSGGLDLCSRPAGQRREPRAGDQHVLGRAAQHPAVGLGAAVDRFLHEEDSSLAGETREQLLRTLIDEIPPQVGESDDRTMRGHMHLTRG
jgi:hypothetical protein